MNTKFIFRLRSNDIPDNGIVASQDLPWDFLKVYPSIEVQNTFGYPNHSHIECRENFHKFDGDPTLAVTHVVNYMMYASGINVLHEYVLTKICVYYMESSQRKWIADSCDPKSIWSSTNLVEEFIRCWGPTT
jgi:hypothetical protein